MELQFQKGNLSTPAVCGVPTGIGLNKLWKALDVILQYQLTTQPERNSCFVLIETDVFPDNRFESQMTWTKMGWPSQSSAQFQKIHQQIRLSHDSDEDPAVFVTDITVQRVDAYSKCTVSVCSPVADGKCRILLDRSVAALYTGNMGFILHNIN